MRFKKLDKIMFHDIPFSCRSDYDIHESVRRLQASVESRFFTLRLRQFAQGKVSFDNVRIQRIIPFFENSHKPFFYGSFKDNGSGPILEGTFTEFYLTKIFSRMWFGFALLFCIGAFVQVFTHSPSPSMSRSEAWEIVLFGLVFVLVAHVMTRFFWWLSRGDIPFISRVIETSLRKGTPNQAL